ncbi:MAG: hypothetical protein D6694_07455 [Gammaproteobacteria bacterium]|nr:MAG: hypothetical protein D6694_07455 [Gammaproteobacteria bacterium]
MVALAAIGVAISAASAVSSISAQNRQAKLQSQSLADQTLLSNDRLALAKENREFAKQWSKVQATQEQMVLLAQRDQAKQDIQSQALQAQMAATQARMEKAGLRTNIAQMNAEMLSQISGIRTEAAVANANQLEESELLARTGQANQTMRQMSAVMSGTGEPGSLSALANDEKEAQGISAMQQRIEEGVRTNEAQATLATRAMEDTRRINNELGQISLDGMESNISAQERSTAASTPFAYRNLQRTVRRNQLAIRAQRFSGAAAQDASYISQVAAEKTNQLAMSVQQKQIQRPGFLSYLSAGAGIGMQAYQAGLFNRTPSQPGVAIPSQNVSQTTNAVRGGLLSTQLTMKGLGMAEVGRQGIINRPYYRYVDVTGNTYG